MRLRQRPSTASDFKNLVTVFDNLGTVFDGPKPLWAFVRSVDRQLGVRSKEQADFRRC
jgi:hypothetical protein